MEKKKNDLVGDDAHGGREDLGPADRPELSHDVDRRTVVGNGGMLAAMALLAAQAPPKRISYELQAQSDGDVPTILGFDWGVRPAFGIGNPQKRNGRRRRNQGKRSAMQKASRKRNRR